MEWLKEGIWEKMLGLWSSPFMNKGNSATAKTQCVPISKSEQVSSSHLRPSPSPTLAPLPDAHRQSLGAHNGARDLLATLLLVVYHATKDGV